MLGLGLPYQETIYYPMNNNFYNVQAYIIKVSIAIFLWLTIPIVCRAQQSFATYFSESEQRGDAVYSALLYDVTSQRLVASYMPNRTLIPASVVKVITTATAIRLLPQYPFITDFYYNGSSLLIKGGGDPTIYSKYFPNDSIRFRESLLSTLRARNIKALPEGVIIDASVFDKVGFNPLWADEDRGDWYGCGVYGFNIFDNWIDLSIKTGRVGSKPVVVKTYPDSTGVIWNNMLRTAKRGFYSQGDGAQLSNRRTIKGVVPPNRSNYELSVDLPTPPAFASLFFTRLLNNWGINTTGEARYSFSDTELTPQYKLIGRYYSPLCDSIVRACNVNSINHYAEALLKRIALTSNNKPATTQNGIDVLLHFWEGEGVTFTDHSKIVDGSGLSRSNRISADDLSKFLIEMAKNSAFRNSLPLAGSEGTVKKFLKGTPYKAYLKSGSMRAVKSYAGYIVTPSGNTYVVVMLSNKVKYGYKVAEVMRKAIEVAIE